MSNLNIRRARIDDVSPCLTIYNYEVVNGVATLDLEPRTLPEWQEWFDAHKTSEHCIFVGLMDDIVAVSYTHLDVYKRQIKYSNKKRYTQNLCYMSKNVLSGFWIYLILKN